MEDEDEEELDDQQDNSDLETECGDYDGCETALEKKLHQFATAETTLSR